MSTSSYEYLSPLLQAHKDGRWGKIDHSTPQLPYYLALEALAQEHGLPFRRVKFTLPYYPNSGVIIKEAVVSAMVLFREGKPVLRDLQGNETPARIIRAFAKLHKLDVELSGVKKGLPYWYDADPRSYGPTSPSRERLAIIIDSGRACLQSFYLEQADPPSKTKSPSRRM